MVLMKNLKSKLSKKHGGPPLVSSQGDFVGSCDNITFGSVNGHSFHTTVADWSTESRVRWAKANALLFISIAQKLNDYAELVAKEDSKNTTPGANNA